MTAKSPKLPPYREHQGIGLDDEAAHSTNGRTGSRTVVVLAGLSLAVNLLAAGAYLGSSYFATKQAAPGAIDRRFDELAQKLAISPEADPGFTALKRAFRIATEVRRARSQPLVDDILEEFGKPAPDPQRIRSLQDQVIAVRRATGDEVLGALVAFLEQATPQERKAMLALLADHKDPATTPLRYGLMP
jgi:hypothetical protein